MKKTLFLAAVIGTFCQSAFSGVWISSGARVDYGYECPIEQSNIAEFIGKTLIIEADIVRIGNTTPYIDRMSCEFDGQSDVFPKEHMLCQGIKDGKTVQVQVSTFGNLKSFVISEQINPQMVDVQYISSKSCKILFK